MAGDWIKLEHATISKPEVIAMADLLEKTPEEVFGMLFHVWCWFDKQSRDGNAGSVTGNALMRYIDHIVRLPGFANCMKQVGWLTDSGMPNFDRHNGESAKKRALTNDRVKRSRNANSNASVTLDALPEKRREESKEGASGSVIFGEGLQVLLSAGHPEKSARSFLGMCLANWDESFVREALLSAAGKADPLAYARGVLNTKPKKPKAPEGSNAVLAKLREKWPSARLASDGRAFFDPVSQARFSLSGERLVGA